MNNLRLRFESDIMAVKQIVRDVLCFLEQHAVGLTDDDIADLRLVFSELLFNAVIHGNNKDVTKSVHVVVEVQDGLVSASVADEGSGFDYTLVLNNIDSNDYINESGRGLRLAYSLMDTLTFNSQGNQISFCKKISIKGGSGR